ncbi:MAG: hypothetical protein V3S33_07490 [Gammaproteobacteria bacterium]
MALFALLVPGYAPAADKTLKIDPRHVVGVQNMRSEITSMLEGLGYEWQPVRDHSTGQPVQVAEEYGQYRMLFRAADNVSVQVEVHIRRDDMMTGLHFSEVGADQLSDAAMDYYRKLKDQVVLEFGADNVSDTHSFMTP